MKVFVTGATGAIGKRAVPALVAAGHDVTGVARDDSKAEQLRAAGADAVRVDLFDPPALTTAVAGHGVVCNLATSIPPPAKALRTKAWAMNDRIRREASRNLVDAALAAGASRFVQESIAFLYPDSGDRLVDEDVPLEMPAFAEATALAEAQARRFTEAGGTGVVLRFGFFYGAGSQHTDDMVRFVRHRVASQLGPPDAYFPAIHLDDAAAAIVAAFGAPAGVYNVVDDEPLRVEAFYAALADAFGYKPPRFTMRAVAKLAGSKADIYQRSQRVSNARFEEAAGWAPRYPSAREGWVQVAHEMAETPEQETPR
jgi:nucleoside-diphosphate-sugar epimerase